MKIEEELDSLGLAGVIVNVVVTGLESLGSLVLFIIGILTIDSFGFLYLLGALIIGTLAVIALIFNAKVLAGELQYKKLASILGFICLSILGSVLLIISKLEVGKDENNYQVNLVNTLTKFKEILDLGAITEEEFITLKKNLIK